MKEAIIEEFKSYSIKENEEVVNIRTGKILTYNIRGGYKTVDLYFNSKKKTSRFVHRLMAIAFIPNPNNYPIINHIDGNKLNNALDNLEWCTHSHNTQHAVDMGMMTNSHYYKMHNKHKKRIYNTDPLEFYMSIKDASERTGVQISKLSSMLNGNTPNETNLRFLKEFEDKYSKVFLYSGESIMDIVNRYYNARLTIECRESKVSIEEYSDISNGLCKFKYQIFNYDLSPDELYVDDEISFMTLFDFIKDNSLCPIGFSVREYVLDYTRDCLKYYILHQRKN